MYEYISKRKNKTQTIKFQSILLNVERLVFTSVKTVKNSLKIATSAKTVSSFS